MGDIVTSEKNLALLARELQNSRCISLDTETTGTDSMRDRLVGISLSTGPGKSWYIPVGHDHGEQLALPIVQQLLGSMLFDPV